MIITVVWQCLLIANIICEITSKEEAIHISPSDISSWSTTRSQEGCGESICPKGIKRCLLQKMKEKLAQRNSRTPKDQPILMNLQMPKMYQKATVNRRNLDVTLDNPLAISEIPREETIKPTVSYQNTDNNFANTEEITKNEDYPENSSTKILDNLFEHNSKEVQTELSNGEVKDLDNSTVNYSLREIFHKNYHKYHNASYCKYNDSIMYIKSDNEGEQLKSAPSTFPSREENQQFKSLLSNVNNFQKLSGEYANEEAIINNNNNNNPIADFNNDNRQTSMRDENLNRNSNPKIPEYLFIDGQYVREDGVMNRVNPQAINDNNNLQGINDNNNLTPKVTQYNFIDGQYIPENVNVQNRFSSDTESQIPTEKPNIQTQMNNLNNQKHIMITPLFVMCSHPIFTFYIEHSLPIYQVNHLPNSKENYDNLVRVWVPQWY